MNSRDVILILLSSWALRLWAPATIVNSCPRSTQWAAVSTQLAEIMDPPHCQHPTEEHPYSFTFHGYAWGVASSPFMIFGATEVSMNGLGIENEVSLLGTYAFLGSEGLIKGSAADSHPIKVQIRVRGEVGVYIIQSLIILNK